MHIIFDWSGTLCNDGEIAYEATCEAIENLGGQRPDKNYFDSGFRTPAVSFYRDCGANCEQSQADEAYFQVYSGLADKAKLFPDVIHVLANLARFHDLYIVSTVKQDILERQIKRFNLSEYFKECFGSVIKKEKVFEQITSNLSQPGEQCFAVGDSLHDMESAKSVSIPFGAAVYGYLPEQIWDKLEVEHKFYSVWEVLDTIQQTNLQRLLQIPLVTVGGLVFSGEGDFLLVKTRKWSGLYGTPGGKVKYGESLEEAFHREIKEETGLEVENVEFILNQDCIAHPQFYISRHFVLVNYTARVKKNTSHEVKLNHESQDYCWCNIKNSGKMEINQPTQVLIDCLRKRGTL